MTQQELNCIREVVREELDKQSNLQQHLNQATNRIREFESNNRSLLEECRQLNEELVEIKKTFRKSLDDRA